MLKLMGRKIFRIYAENVCLSKRLKPVIMPVAIFMDSVIGAVYGWETQGGGKE